MGYPDDCALNADSASKFVCTTVDQGRKKAADYARTASELVEEVKSIESEIRARQRNLKELERKLRRTRHAQQQCVENALRWCDKAAKEDRRSQQPNLLETIQAPT